LLLIEVLDDDLSFDDYKSLATLKKRKQRKAERKRRHESARAEAAEFSIVLSSEQADGEEQDIGSTENTSSDEPSVPRNRSSTQLPTTVHMPSPLNTSFTPNDLPRDDNSLQSIPSDLNANPEVDQQTKTASEFAERMRTAAIMLAQLQQQSVAIKLAPASSSSSGNKSAAARTKLVTEGIRQRIIKEMMALEEQRMAKMKVEGVEGGIGGGGGEGAGGTMLEDENRVALVVNKEDPSGKFEVLSTFLCYDGCIDSASFPHSCCVC
jgi:phosphatidylinositol 4-kinase B